MTAVLRELDLPAQASSASTARQVVREALEQGGRQEWAYYAQLAVSEIVTNALVHAGTALHLLVSVGAESLRVEVHDGSSHLPQRRQYSPASGTGRGLRMVEDSVDDWGSFEATDGKVVWFEIGDASRESPVDVAGPQALADETTVHVRLLNFPLLMHAAWQEHATALLREFLLVEIDGQDDVAAFERHAEASDAMNLLFEQVPVPPREDDPDAIMAGATEPGVSAAELDFRVPRASVTHFETLDSMLDEALVLAHGGDLLVPPTQPEIAEFRRWICTQVRSQARSSAPAPWAPDLNLARFTERSPVPGWDAATVSGSERAVLATDETSVVVAVSASAARFLGYCDDELVGHRVISIIPSRYRQAHIAGTTLHFTNGRSPLLGKPVTVPVLRADGTEVLISVVVEPGRIDKGQRLFLAEFLLDTAAEPAP